MKTKHDWNFASESTPERGTKIRWIVRTGIILAVINLLAFVAAPLSRLHLNVPGTIAFQLFTYTVQIGLVLAATGLVLSIITAFMKTGPGWKSCLFLLLLGLSPIGAVLGYIGPDRYRDLMIHDISTDTSDPPEFVEAVKLRGTGENSTVYSDRLAARQRAAYPNLGPIVSRLSLDDALTEATQVVKDLGWEFINVDYDKGIIEAYASTPVFGLTDDIVIRVRREGSGSRIDVRSSSRYRTGEPGINVERIRQFASAFRG